MKQLQGSLTKNRQLYTHPLSSIDLIISTDDLKKELEAHVNTPVILNRYNHSIQLSKPEKVAFTREEIMWIDQYLHRTLRDNQSPATRSLILEGDDRIAEAYVNYLYKEDFDFIDENELSAPFFQILLNIY